MKKASFFLITGLVLVLVTTGILNTAGLSYAPEPIYHAEGVGKKVFFTFNVLWEMKNLQNILELLDKHEAKVIFFVTGHWLKRFPNEAAEIIARGHQLGNKTVTNRSLLLLTEEEITEEIANFNTLSKELLDYSPTFFRPSYGEYTLRIVRLAAEQGCTTLLWSINALILPGIETEMIFSHLEENLHDGAIILFHTNSPELEETLPEIIDFLEWKGYTIGSPILLNR